MLTIFLYPLQSRSCAVATAQIVWPLPATCGDESQASRIMEEINRLAPTGRVRPFHNKCGTWFFTASLSPLQIQQLMGEKIGIKFIAPDVEMKDDMESSPKVQKRRSDKLFGNRQSRTQKRSRPDFIHVRFEPLETAQLSYMSTPPDRVNSQLKFAWFDSVGSGATVYWIDRQFYLLNAELEIYNMAANRLMAEDVSPQGEEWTSIQHGDHGGCMLSMIGGPRLGIMPQQIERGGWPQLKIVRVEPLVSSFFSGIEAIINELELRTERNEQIHTYTVIGSALTVPEPQFGRYLQAEAAILFKMLTNTFQAVVVVSAGPASELQPTNIWPAAIARQYPDIPIIAAKGADLYGLSGRGFGAQDPFPILRAVDIGRCKYINTDRYLYGSEPAIAYITGLATDMLTRPKVRTKLFIDNPALAPDEQKLQASRPVSAKIRDYLDSKSYDRMDGYRDIDQPMNAELRGVWNGLDPDDLDINSYEA